MEGGEKCFQSPFPILCGCGAFHLCAKKVSGNSILGIYEFSANSKRGITLSVSKNF